MPTNRYTLPLSVLMLVTVLLLLSACARQQTPPPAATAVPATAVAQIPPTDTAVPPLPRATNAPPPTPRPRDTATPVPAPPTDVPAPTATESATETPAPTATAVPTDIPAPTAMPTPEPTATLAVPLPDWLNFLNRFRAMAALPPVTDWEEYTRGSKLHSEYMAVNDAAIAHSQDKANPLYTDAGDRAAKNGNIFATSQTEANYIWSINFWASAPFHLIAMLDPKLGLVGYGDSVENGGDVKMAAVLDVGSDPGISTAGIQFPIIYPGPGSATWVVRHSLYEWPDPVASCPGMTRPAGSPIILMLGTGNVTPRVANHRLALGNDLIDSCLFDETSYTNPDAYAQKIGRQILNGSDAIVIIPYKPLAADQTYTAQITTNGQTYTWEFKTVKRPE